MQGKQLPRHNDVRALSVKNMQLKQLHTYAYAIIYIIIILIAAHVLADDAYQWQINSISQLGAQSYDRAWIIRLGFIGFGLIIGATSVQRIRQDEKHWLGDALIMVYGLAIFLSGIFSAEPFIAGAVFSVPEARLHGLFATVAGFALTIAILFFTFTDTPPQRRIGHFAALVLVTLLSGLFGLFPNFAGITQRVLWVVGFVWLVYTSWD